MDACVGAWTVNDTMITWPGDQPLFNCSDWENTRPQDQLGHVDDAALYRPDSKNNNSSDNNNDSLFRGYIDNSHPNDAPVIYPSPSVAAVTAAKPGHGRRVRMPNVEAPLASAFVQHQQPIEWPQDGISLTTPAIPEYVPYEPSNNFGWGYQMSYDNVGPFDHIIYTGEGSSNTSASSSPMISGLSDGDDLDGGYAQPPGWDAIEGVEPVDPCYAQLLYKCLSEAPDHTLTLKDLYEWVREHSQKAKDPKNKGWQNSVRHNLSMNAAFERVTCGPSQTSKKGSSWRLTPTALRDGVISTTRYRKDPKQKTIRRGAPQLKRQISGAKGGQATRNAARHQRALREARSVPNFMTRQRQQPFLVGPPRSITAPDQQWLPTSQPTLPPPPPQHAPSSMPMPFPQSTSPYYSAFDEVSSSQTAPNTPPQVLFPPEQQAKSSLSDWTAGYINYSNGGIVGEYDDFSIETPTTTEASYMSEDLGLHGVVENNPAAVSLDTIGVGT